MEPRRSSLGDGRVEQDTAAEECCAICFELRPPIELPCACQVDYCATCWDRALASSVTVRGHAQCPSCRSAFRVDFDSHAGGLVFSVDSDGTPSGEWRTRLYSKVKPVQIQLLRNFGSSLTALPSTHSSPRSPSCRGSRCEDGAENRCTTGTNRDLPLCVCGAHLELVSSRSRILRMLEDTDSNWRSRVPQADTLVDRLLSGALVTCDLCDEVATNSGCVWTCKNGPHTVLHPAAYDVCEGCFARYAGADVAAFCKAADKAAVCNQPLVDSSCCLAVTRGVLPPWRWRRPRPPPAP
mmetsp:Transcript_103200/g.205075  ORF Transcript_103200/g.205075 Transcript_103200/m.205075 type:complete len:296 (+) Transcript_103200:64-951(+)